MTFNALHLLIICLGIFLAYKSIFNGTIVATPSFGYWIASSLEPEFALIVWLISCFVFGAVVLLKMGSINVRNTKTESK